MNANQKAAIYGFANILCFVLLAFIAIFLIFRYIESFGLRIFFSVISFIAAAYFEERVLSRIVNRIVAFFLHDTF
ncbi:MAG: hypothetical protein J6Z40_12435 [Oscillospiraceae bacterium]|nr:hypothetical protein [Oscillospiraceae bacterium]MBQ5339960.1 hypothetical protein [Oscillospiraceae bacterium]